jgi:prepilin-type N-terminal cleavage/methylation domain-containing protein
MKQRKRHSAGFTLMELMVVILILGIVAAVTMPRFAPAIAFTELEGAAKHMANFGRSAMAEAVMLQQDITVRIDLNEQRYSAVRWVDPKVIEEEQEKEESGEEDMLARLSDLKSDDSVKRFGARGTSPPKTGATGQLDYRRYMATLNDFFGEIPEDFDEDLADQQMADRFDRFAKRITVARAENVKHDGFLDEIQIFDNRGFDLEDDQEPVEMAIENPTLLPVRIPSSTRLERVSVDGVVSDRGLVEVDLSPLGLSSKVGFHFVNDSGSYFTVFWDPTLGGARTVDGKEPIDE